MPIKETVATPNDHKALPSDVLNTYFSPELIALLGQTCRALQQNATTETLWEEKFKRHFPEEAARLAEQPNHPSETSNLDDNSADATKEIDYHAEFIKTYQQHYKGLSNREKEFFSQVKEGVLSKSAESEQLITFLNAEDSNGLTSMHWAVKLGHQHLLDAWYQQIEPLYHDTNGSPDFIMRIESRSLSFWCIALNQQSLLDNIIAETNSHHALFIAAEYGYDNILKSLLGKTNSEGEPISDIHRTNYNGYTMLHVAADHGRANVVRELFAHINEPEEKARYINATGRDGKTALHWATRHGHANVVRELFAHINEPEEKARFINATNRYGDTALHLAATHGHADVVIELLANNANPSLKQLTCHHSSISYSAPKMLARINEHNRIVDIFNWHEAASSSNCDTPRKKAMAVFAAEKTFKPLVTFGFKSKNIFRQIYETLQTLKDDAHTSSDIKSYVALAGESAQLNPADREKLDNLVAYLDKCVFEPAIKAAEAASAKCADGATSTTFFKPADTLNDQIKEFKQQVTDAIKTEDGCVAVNELLKQQREGEKYEPIELGTATEKTFTQLDAAFNAIKEQVKGQGNGSPVLDVILNDMQATLANDKPVTGSTLGPSAGASDT